LRGAEILGNLLLLAERHETLRTRFDLIDGRRVQIVDPVGDLPIDEHLFSGDDLHAVVSNQRDMRFSLDRQHGWRATLLLDEWGTPHHLVICLHHALVDWYGVDQLGREFMAVTGKDRASRRQFLERPILRPRDLAVAQRAPQWRERCQRSLRYWRRVLEEIGSPAPPSLQSTERVDFHLRSIRMWRSLQTAVQRFRISVQSLLLALMAVMVARVGDTRLPVLQLYVSNRHHQHWRPIVACLTQIVPLAVDLGDERQDVFELAQSVHRGALTCMLHGCFDPDEFASFAPTLPVSDYQFNFVPQSSMANPLRVPLDRVTRVAPRYTYGPRLRVWAVAGDDLEVILRVDPSLVPEPAAHHVLHWFEDEICRLAEGPTRLSEMMARLGM